MLEVAEGIHILVCGSTYAHDHVIDFNCEVIIPLNGDALRYHQIQQICHTWPAPLWSCPEVHACGVSSCALDGHILVHVLYFFCMIFIMSFVLLMPFVIHITVPLIGPLQ